ncbi:carbonic anhydrase [Bosea sp. OK403]|uniref:carbonic anhydrase n=1 Tax=Bosea sp. OK403 TaxID=1855286 RepID=UPI0008E381C5|nr:carbonic anhydrase [Bosea sp. OK403]SFJ76895.1 carbonic anhydrase [Bosea sp. OK403]
MSRTLDYLFDRNVAWAWSKTQDDPRFFRRMAEQQTPRYLWIGCSDSRVTANDVLGLDPGEVFVHRNIANIVHTSDMNILSVIEYAVEQLKVEHIIVCGHYGCGGVERALMAERGAILDHWLQPISMLHRKHLATFDAIRGETARLDRMCEINVEMQVRRVAQTPIVENAWARGQELNLHGWIYRIQDGLLRELGPHLSSICERDALPSIDQRVLTPVGGAAPAWRKAHAAPANRAWRDTATGCSCPTAAEQRA